jgi:hypothetical protein
MPGVPALAAELGVDPKTAGLALHLLEEKGLLVGQLLQAGRENTMARHRCAGRGCRSRRGSWGWDRAGEAQEHYCSVALITIHQIGRSV